jgi:hypothetical protein
MHRAVVWGQEAAERVKSEGVPFKHGGLVDKNTAFIRKMAEGGDVKSIPVSEQIGRKVREAKIQAAKELGLADIYMRSLDIPEKTYGEAEAIGGRTDAMRHLLLQAMLTKKYGPTAASVIGGIHEFTSIGQPKAEKEMDMFNDRLGREIGEAALDDNEMVRMAKEYVDTGKAKVLEEGYGANYAKGGPVNAPVDPLSAAQDFIRRVRGR